MAEAVEPYSLQPGMPDSFDFQANVSGHKNRNPLARAVEAAITQEVQLSAVDDLTASLATSVQVTKSMNSTAAPHPRFAQYKVKLGKYTQEERRRRLLEIQKKKRLDYTNHMRRLMENDWSNMSEDEDEEKSESPTKEKEVETKQQVQMEGIMQFQKSPLSQDSTKQKQKPIRFERPTPPRKRTESEEAMEVDRPARPGRYYKDQLMYSEWLVDIPDDFAAEWLAVPCPIGKRVLVIAAKGETASYSKAGYCFNRFPSCLPSGSLHTLKKQTDCTLLDAIYCEAARTYYCLDVLSWTSLPVVDSETDFRFFWLRSRLDETPHVAKQTRGNPYKFISLPYYPCTSQGITALLTDNVSFMLDGLLFYHKRTNYTFGTTPLVGWLKPFMIQEMLGIPVPDKHLQLRPKTYTNKDAFIEDFNKSMEKKMRKINRKTPPKKAQTEVQRVEKMIM